MDNTSKNMARYKIAKHLSDGLIIVLQPGKEIFAMHEPLEKPEKVAYLSDKSLSGTGISAWQQQQEAGLCSVIGQ